MQLHVHISTHKHQQNASGFEFAKVMPLNDKRHELTEKYPLMPKTTWN